MGFDPGTALDMGEHEIEALLDIYVETRSGTTHDDTTTTRHVSRRKRPT